MRWRVSKFIPIIEHKGIVTIKFNNDLALITIENVNGQYTLDAPSEELRNFLNEFIGE